ncbi:MAG TPA: ABC transporter substrate-binding protein [Candidatus Paceibacterota bacterium]|nr:ABC transporter substrate-binding protein [Candidatus Paceibacterota bacterium]
MNWFKKIFGVFTRGERVLFVIAFTGAVASFIVVMSIVFVSVTRAVPAAGGDFTEGMIGQPEYVNPVIATSETDLGLVKMVYSNLEGIADNVSVSSDTRVWTVHLKDGLTWHDGQKLTSDDIVFTVQSIQDPDAQSPLYPSWQGVAASRVSELEVQFNLVNPYANFGDTLKNLYILPKHLFADAPPGNWHLSEYNLKPIGSGPYKFDSYDKAPNGFITSYNLAAWNGNGDNPLIQNFNFQFFNDENSLVAAFNSGQIDAFGNASPEAVSEINRPYDTFSWRTSSYYAVFFNQSKNLALQDPAVRMALADSLDRQDIVNQVWGAHAVPAFGPIPPDAPYAINIVTTSSLDFASTTLTNAGWVMQPAPDATDASSTNTGSASASSSVTETPVPPGFRYKLVNHSVIPLAINLTVPEIDFLAKTATVIQNTWESLGVQVNLMPASADVIVNQDIKNRDYEALIFGNVLGPSSDLYAFWDSSERFYPGLNLSIYSNPKVDKAIEDARENASTTAITNDYNLAENQIVNDNPAIFLYSPDYTYVTDKDVQGVAPQLLSDPSDRFLEVPTWYLNTARVLK